MKSGGLFGERSVAIWTVLGSIATVIALVITFLTLSGSSDDSHASSARTPVGSSPTHSEASPATSPTATSPSSESSSSESPETASSTPGVPNGTKVAEYSFQMVAGQSVPLRTSAPTQKDFGTGDSGDVFLDPNFSAFTPVGVGKTQYTLPAGTTLTYQACTSTTTPSTRIGAVTGVSFCVAENNLMVGISVTSVSHFANGPVGVSVTVWENAS